MTEKISERPDGEYTIKEIFQTYYDAEHDEGENIFDTILRIQDEDGVMIPVGAIEMNNGELFILVPSIMEINKSYDDEVAVPVVPAAQNEHPEHEGEQTLWEAAGLPNPDDEAPFEDGAWTEDPRND